MDALNRKISVDMKPYTPLGVRSSGRKMTYLPDTVASHIETLLEDWQFDTRVSFDLEF